MQMMGQLSWQKKPLPIRKWKIPCPYWEMDLLIITTRDRSSSITRIRFHRKIFGGIQRRTPMHIRKRTWELLKERILRIFVTLSEGCLQEIRLKSRLRMDFPGNLPIKMSTRHYPGRDQW